MPRPAYDPVANPNFSPDSNTSPNPDRNSNFLDPEANNLFGRPGSEYAPAPSLMSRDSTAASMNLMGGTPSLAGTHRDSWGSGIALTGAEGATNGNRNPGRSGLANSTVPYGSGERLSTSDEDDEHGHITPAVAAIGAGTAARGISEKPRWAESGSGKGKKNRKWLWAALAALLIVAIGLGVGLGVGLTRNRDSKTLAASSGNENSSPSSQVPSGASSASGSATATSTSATASATPTTGTQGSLITLEDGSTMTYDNPYGGKWVWDEANPFKNEAQANSWTPALNQNWTWGQDKVFGVNLGGWLVIEPFIVPGLYEKYANGSAGTAIDEYTLSINMGDNLTAALTEHYETFITERDFAEIVAAGLNWVRIPIPFFAIEVWEGEPYLPKVSWQYFLKAIKWARKYGLRVNLDLHSVPGSQNGWNHSGRQGSVNWMNGVMGLANAQRSLDYIRTLAQFIAQPEYAPVIQMFGFLNEPNGNAISKGPVASFYIEAHNIIRDITGIGSGNGPMLSMHDGFLGVTAWYGDLAGADRMMLDQHTYMVFQDQPQGTLDTLKTMPCQWWASSTNTTSQQWGPNTAGEWSAAWNDCGKWVNNVGSGSRYDGTYDGYANKATGSCDYWNDYTQWNQSTIDALNHFVSGSMDALQNFFFWTWKIGNSTDAIQQPNPFWHYRLGLEKGWIPKDPRTVAGTCQADGVSMNNFDGTFSNAYVTGGAGAGTIAASASSSYPWPPASFTNVASDSMSLLPQYTQTGTPITMPGPTFTSPGSSATIDAGNGWFNANANDKQAYAAISGCSYPPEYSAADLAVPTGACGAGLSQANKRSAEPTPAPTRR
ncbi:glucan 1,3-beta-glucosidase [Cryptococcus neoformans AD2-60a]|uniref:glucan 1,3-beta-glucosidase n=1 Tax=Cryptococcus neoformans Tu259-1 TaxID=1230072 RepID=A0A854QCS1_CRYNE|nr:glucan 1,3-beta-glucosidase [Cryptococcus neoformans var. grubii AD2-60a]OWZ47512.1 glucan 1,3-beta-glucosidase [Cryptococcus neoformans var. grubii AD1-83a]OWZ61378.1 hypothetical protein AYX15_06405 [Cryptococcus neoformans var. grubii]OWZ78913.1 glucan 1,3-beta-glucosidase [Cryptococcus neoformans var. grubii Bt85]OXC85417.1 glucan 1,3-beta-glucosidase [Cryptococcus neoformans var. grubii AD1-7a]OXG19563.1 glucan 1,3-beta-glucosidase [Cryptococcus neoformans var. grubii Tu401-1]OXG23994